MKPLTMNEVRREWDKHEAAKTEGVPCTCFVCTGEILREETRDTGAQNQSKRKR